MHSDLVAAAHIFLKGTTTLAEGCRERKLPLSEGDGGSLSSRSSADDIVPVDGVLGSRLLKSPVTKSCIQHTIYIFLEQL